MRRNDALPRPASAAPGFLCLGDPFVFSSIRALGDHFPKGTSAALLIDALKNAHGRMILRSSLSPQFLWQKDDEILELDGKLWELPQKRKEPPSVRTAALSWVKEKADQPLLLRSGSTPNRLVWGRDRRWSVWQAASII